jgi:glutamate-1-semialdehyde 2,1-aminomutase
MTTRGHIDRHAQYAMSEAAHSSRLEVIPGGVNSNVRLASFPVPLTFVRGSGSRIWDVDGNEYVDYAMGMGPHILGHAPEPVTRAVREAVKRGQLFAGQTQEEGELAQIIVDRFAWIDQVRFGQSGSEMDLLAVRIARAATGRQRIVRFAGHYHGWLDPLFVVPGNGEDTTFALTPGQSRASAQDVIQCPWNDIDVLTGMVEQHGDSIAAVLMEPVMCNTGVIEPSEGYLEAVRTLCTRYGIVLVIDEVITGFRTGLTGEQGRVGALGDLTVYAKAIASGYPLAALGGRVELLELVNGGGVNHSGTYNTGLVQMAAGLATVQHLIETDPYPAIIQIGSELRGAINAIASEEGIGLVCEGPGPMLQLRFGAPGTSRNAASYAANSDASLLSALVSALQSRGVRVTSRGLLFLSAAHCSADVELTTTAVRESLQGI